MFFYDISNPSKGKWLHQILANVHLKLSGIKDRKLLEFHAMLYRFYRCRSYFESIAIVRLVGVIGSPFTLLNNHYRKSFADFINIFRVNYVKEKLRKNDALQQITIEALGNQAGFSSKSNFFLTFKKHTGMSPLEYIRNGKLGP